VIKASSQFLFKPIIIPNLIYKIHINWPVTLTYTFMYDLQVAQLKLDNNFPLCPMRAILPDKSIVYVQMLQQKYTDSDAGNKYFFSCGAATQRGSWSPHS